MAWWTQADVWSRFFTHAFVNFRGFARQACDANSSWLQRWGCLRRAMLHKCWRCRKVLGKPRLCATVWLFFRLWPSLESIQTLQGRMRLGQSGDFSIPMAPHTQDKSPLESCLWADPHPSAVSPRLCFGLEWSECTWLCLWILLTDDTWKLALFMLWIYRLVDLLTFNFYWNFQNWSCKTTNHPILNPKILKKEVS